MAANKNIYAIYLLIFFVPVSYSQTVSYSPAYFGPNANPVPEFSNATIPALTTIQLSESYFFGFGDNTSNITFSAEVPLLPERVSLKAWFATFENYRVTQAVYDERSMEGNELSGAASGDFYVQARTLVLLEKKFAPSIILNSTLKTASGTNFGQRRYFDTPGYYFDMEIGKSFLLKSKLISEVRMVANFGFLCWETTNSTQNDAPMYGGKIILSNRFFDFESTLSGYYGWITNGDAPLVYSAKLNFKPTKFNLFVQYQYGLCDFPYRHILAGIAFRISKLTPQYKFG
ncbi:MAG: hypothetical protein LBL94_00325 [Prevotellaceae bacterium]|jgi:hypothetical protein|nr:hypothetical protein [Prevotellaceae bacterium]